jgi:RNA 2',3'-cyclic 3'-phosphodiesterase
MRLFVGLALSDEAKQRLERLSLRLRAPDDGLRWSLQEQWHITLVFLGTVEASALKALLAELRQVRGLPVQLEIDGLGTFERAGVLYAAVEVTSGLARLQSAVDAAVRAAGVATEDRPYRPHITLARSRNRNGSHALQGMRGLLEQQRLRVGWVAQEFLLYESELSPTGSRYRVRERLPLAAAAGQS